MVVLRFNSLGSVKQLKTIIMGILDSNSVSVVLSHPATWMLGLVLIIAVVIAANDFVKGFNK